MTDFLTLLAELGQPMFRARPAAVGETPGGATAYWRQPEWTIDDERARDWKGGHNNCGFWLPKAWQSAKPYVMPNHGPHDAVCLVGGTLFDVIDIDVQNGGEDEWEKWLSENDAPKIYAEIETPSGGRHLLIATIDTAEMDGWIQGSDFKGGRADGTSRGFAFTVGTRKLSKTTGELCGYNVIDQSGLEQLRDLCVSTGMSALDFVAQDRSGEAVRTRIEGLRSKARKVEGGRPENYVAPPWNPFSNSQCTEKEARQRVAWQLDNVRVATRGNVYNTLNTAALQIGHFVGSLLVEQEATRLLHEALEENPWVQDWKARGRPGTQWDDKLTVAKGLRDGQASGWMAVVDQPRQTATLVVTRSLDATGAVVESVTEIDNPFTMDDEEVPEGWDWTVNLVVSGTGRPTFLDLAEVIGGGEGRPRPCVLRWKDREDSIFYAGAVNTVFGDPECGKSWIILGAIAQVLHDGGRAVFIDMDHNGPVSIIERLELLGTPRAVILDKSRFRYAEPEDAGHVDEIVAALRARTEALGEVVDDLTEFCAPAFPGGPATVVGVDSIGEMVPMLGGNSNDADDYSKANRRVLTRLAAGGACVIAADHMAKGQDSRQYGAGGTMAKKRAVDGSYIRVEIASPFTPGAGGASHLFVVKDRHGGLREKCEQMKDPYAGTFVMCRPDATGATQWYVKPPKRGEKVDGIGGGEEAEDLALMRRRLVKAIATAGENTSQIQILDSVPGRKPTKLKCITEMVEEGLVRLAPRSGRGGGFVPELIERAALTMELQAVRDALLTDGEPDLEN